MKARWIVLATVGISVTVVDQWTKFLAVKHLTPGIAKVHQTGDKPLTAAAQEEILEGLSFSQSVGTFFSSVKHPCRGFGARCPTVKVVDGFWNWRYVENPGAAWGLLAGTREKYRVPFFIVVSLAAIAFIIGFFRKLEEDQKLLVAALSLVFGGAIGNFIDRIHLAYVIDFIDWYVGTAHWPTFNFADAAITCGVGLLIIEWARDAIRAKKGQGADASSESAA